MYILRKINNNDKYTPVCEIYRAEDSLRLMFLVKTSLLLPRSPTDADVDSLRSALKNWAHTCGFGELAEREF